MSERSGIARVVRICDNDPGNATERFQFCLGCGGGYDWINDSELISCCESCGKESDLVLFTRQLSTMIEAGISLVQALTALYEQADPKRQGGLRTVISDITARVQGGETFHESLAKHPLVFNRLFISMVKAGEHGGLLAEILDRLAGFLEASARLRKKVKSAMTYPVIVVCIAFAITTFLIVRVVPIFGEIFADFGAKLSAPTQFLIDVSNLFCSVCECL